MQMIINGKKTDSSNGKTMNVINPATGKVIDTVPVATKEDVDYAVDCAVPAKRCGEPCLSISAVPLWRNMWSW